MKKYILWLLTFAAFAVLGDRVTKHNWDTLGPGEKVVTDVDLTGLPTDAVTRPQAEQIAADAAGAAKTEAKGYADQKKTEAIAAAKDYTDTAVAGATPGDYSNVSNKAMTAVQTETDPNVADWARKGQPQPTADEKDPHFKAFQSNGGNVTNGVTVVDPSTAAVRTQTAPAGITINEKGVGGEWQWRRVDSSGLWVNDPFFWCWSDFLREESDPTVPSWAKSAQNPSYTKGETYNKSETDALVAQAGKVKKVANVGPDTNGNVPLTTASIGAAKTEDVEEVRTIVQTWEGFLGGSNVVLAVTNYISGAYDLANGKFKIHELRNGEYQEIYDSRKEILLHIDNFSNSYVRVALDAVVDAVARQLAAKADKDWGKYTSSGGTAPSNTVYMTAPQTVFAGGMEFERVAVGEGAIAVLTTKGAPVYTQGDEGTFKFQDAGGTNYFGFAKTDSYTIGCNTDGISVDNHVVTLTYNVTMSGVPCIWYCPSLDVKPLQWEQLNTPDGQPIAGASHVVQWEQNPDVGREVCYLNCPEPKGFFKATIEVAGEAKFITNMPADLSGGVLCEDGITVIYPHPNGTWSTTR